MSTVAAPKSELEPSGSKRFAQALVPLVLLVVVLVAFFAINPLKGFRSGTPPVEELTITRTQLIERPAQIVMDVTNGGIDEVVIAQVLVDGSYREFKADPVATLSRFDRTTITLDYPWVAGEAHAVALLTASGVIIEHDIPVAVATPVGDLSTLLTLIALGIFIGVIPVGIGTLWLGWLRGLSRAWIDSLLALTAGLLVFLAIESIAEALEFAELVPSAIGGLGLFVLGFVVSVVVLSLVAPSGKGMKLATSIAAGIGLHNLGEGLVVGAALATGEVGFSLFLIAGFAIHNVTEGLGIVTPIAKIKVSFVRILILVLIAGGPAAIGTVIGGLSFSPTWAVFFFAVGAGAMLQVVYLLWTMLRKTPAPRAVAIGFAVGVAIMYLTGLLISA